MPSERGLVKQHFQQDLRHIFSWIFESAAAEWNQHDVLDPADDQFIKNRDKTWANIVRASTVYHHLKPPKRTSITTTLCAYTSPMIPTALGVRPIEGGGPARVIACGRADLVKRRHFVLLQPAVPADPRIMLLASIRTAGAKQTTCWCSSPPPSSVGSRGWTRQHRGTFQVGEVELLPQSFVP